MKKAIVQPQWDVLVNMKPENFRGTWVNAKIEKIVIDKYDGNDMLEVLTEDGRYASFQYHMNVKPLTPYAKKAFKKLDWYSY